ncbi:c-type cytochrome [bacterium]|nr:c-type cytochrome [bacterium]
MEHDDYEDKLLDSNYDGIQEYDNDLPSWWIWLFYITIASSVVYVGYYHFGPGNSIQENLAEEMEAHEAIVAAQAQQEEQSGAEEPEDLLQLVNDTGRIESGKEIFIQKCAACHLQRGEGLVGPNLTDNYWIHGGTMEDIKRIIMEGVLEKGMLAWKDQLSTKEINDVTLFVWSIRGTNIEGKAPEGELLEEG